MTRSSDTHHYSLRGPSAKPGPSHGIGSNIVRAIAAVYFKLTGWRVVGDWPKHPKMVLIAAPHTSNWDGLNMLAAAGYYRVKLRWMGKKSLTTGPVGGLMRWLGCVPIDRSARHDVVAQMAVAFDAADTLILAVPPEGTRARAEAWKSGYYRIAEAANVPLLITVLDYRTRTIRLSGILIPSGDLAADETLIKAHYHGAVGRHPEKFTLP